MSRCFHYLFFHQCFWITLISNPWNLDHTLEMPSYLHLPHLLRPPKGITDHRNTKPFKRSKLEGNQILKYHEYTTKIRKVKVKHTLKTSTWENINRKQNKIRSGREYLCTELKFEHCEAIRDVTLATKKLIWEAFPDEICKNN